MKLGSLFDGSGGFPLAGVINGIEPVWASEIEPYPLKVTAARFPHVKQLGDVTKINGAEIDPVDVITFGSPCQDLSVGGKQAGIHDGERSKLFFEAVRIIKEMRAKDAAAGRTDEHCRPRFAVWENVPGSFSSNKGADFQAVLQALAEVCATDVSVPMPPKGKWRKAGCVVGDGWSIAWRTYDAQFWGVPQRRKRIYLVADFASERAGEILFEHESVCGNPAQSRETREGTATDAQGSAGGSFGASVGAFMGGQGAKYGGIGYSEDFSPTIKSVMSGSNTAPDVVYEIDQQGGKGNANYAENVMPTLCSDSHGTPHGVAYAIEGNTVDRVSNKNGKGWCEGVSHTLNTQDKHAVCFAPNGNHCGAFEEAGTSATLTTKHRYGSGGGAELCVFDCRGNGDGATVPTLTGDHQNRVTDYTALCVGNGQLNQISMSEKCNTLDCMHDRQAVITNGKHPRKYIVRRLTPLECCRLQGFPDWWEDGVEGSDSARYKMWGNGIALPCAVDVLRRVAKAGAADA